MHGLTIYHRKIQELADKKTLFSNELINLTVKYKYDYPVLFKKISETILFVLEGKIYDRSLSEIENIIVNRFEDTDFLENLFFDLDGEFNIFLINLKDSTVNVFSDHLNRLPLYYGHNQNGWIVTRDIGTAVKMLNSSFNKINLGEFFVFGYNLENRTFFENIYTLKMDCRLEVNLLTGTIRTVEKTRKHSFLNKNSSEDLEKTYAQMKQLFIESCKNRITEKSVLSLSGGMDSRTVAAGLKAVGSFEAISYLDSDKKATNDAQIASEIAEKINCKWKKIDLSKENMFNDMNELLQLKYGYQTPNLYFLNQYLKKVAEEHGSGITFFTGDGGDKVFPDLSGGVEYNDDKKLFRYIIRNNYVFSLKNAAKLSGTNENDLKKFIFETIISFPGNNSKDKLEYFFISGRARRYLFEGEDRNRQFFWTTTPFYGKDFFKFMMSLDYKIKRNSEFYTNFLKTLNPEIAKIRNENISSGRFVINRSFYNFVKKYANLLLSRKNKEIIKSIFKRTKMPSDKNQTLINEITNKMSQSKLIKDASILKISQYSTQQLAITTSILNVEELLKKRMSNP